MSHSLQILLNGAKGRMGQAITAIASSENAQVFAGLDQGDDLKKSIGNADVVIDFSFHSVTLSVAKICAEHKKPLIIGTTGHTAEEKKQITEAIKGIPVVWAGNYSVGVTLLNALVRQAARALSQAGRWDIEVTEMHHRLKKDAPSGTAETESLVIRVYPDIYFPNLVAHKSSNHPSFYLTIPIQGLLLHLY